MISSELAVDVLIRVNRGKYMPRVYSTTSRQFIPAYTQTRQEFQLDPVIHKEKLAKSQTI
jgi:hypothetical protein